MIMVRDMLKHFYASRCSQLDRIEAYKDKKVRTLDLPLEVRITSSLGVSFLFVFSVTAALDIPFTYLSWMGLFFFIVAYVLKVKGNSFLAGYASLAALFIGYGMIILGIDSYIEDVSVSLKYMAVAAFFLLMVTYKVFDFDIYHFFAIFILGGILSYLCYIQESVWPFQIFFLSWLAIAYLIFMIPSRFVNLYSLAKAMTVFSVFLPIMLFLKNDVAEQYLFLRLGISFFTVVNLALACLYKDRKVIRYILLPVGVLSALVGILTSCGIALSFVIIGIAYILNSKNFALFGLFCHTVFLCIYLDGMEVLPVHRFSAFLGIGCALVLSCWFMEKRIRR